MPRRGFAPSTHRFPMDKELQLIEHLYDEPSAETAPLRELLEDPELAAEYQALSRAKFALDHRPRARPPVHVLNAIVREAAHASHATAPRQDRAPLRYLRTHRRGVTAGFALAAVLALTVMVQPWNLLQSTTPSTPLSADASAPTASESLFESLPPAASPIAGRASDSLPGWDSGDDVRRLSRRIQALQAAGIDRWDEPAVPLEMLPTGSATGVTPAGSRR